MRTGDSGVFGDLARLRRDLDRFSLGMSGNPPPQDAEPTWAPPVDPSGVQAVYRDGVLQITVPRAAPAGPVRLRVDVE